MSEPYASDDNLLRHDIIRKDETIGTQSLMFERKADPLIVRTEVKILVRVALVPVYRYTLNSQLTWHGGELERYSLDLNDNRAKSSMTIPDGPTGLVVDGPTTRKTYPRGLKLNNFWNRDIVNDNVAIDWTKGTLSLYSVAPRVHETVTIGKTSFPARRYTSSGDIDRDVWYDDLGRLLRIKRIARDGSTVLTDLQL